MEIIKKYGISFPVKKSELLNQIKDIQKDLIFLKASENSNDTVEELEIIEKLIEVLEYTSESRVEQIFKFYDYLEMNGALTNELHYVVLDYIKGDFDALTRIDSLCEKDDKNALLAKVYYLENGTFDVINKKEVRRCLEKLYSLGDEGPGKEYMLMKRQTIFSIVLLSLVIISTGIIFNKTSKVESNKEANITKVSQENTDIQDNNDNIINDVIDEKDNVKNDKENLPDDVKDEKIDIQDETVDINEVKNFSKPLSEMKAENTNGFKSVVNTHDSLGNKYDSMIELGSIKNNYANVEYKLDNGFDKFSMIIAPSEWMGDEAYGKFSVLTKQKEDDEWETIYESEEINKYSIPYQVDVDVEDVKRIKLSWYTEYSTITGAGGSIIVCDGVFYTGENRTLDLKTQTTKDVAKLTELRMVTRTNGAELVSKEVFDNQGNELNKQNTLRLHSSGNGSGEASFFVGKSYNKLTGRIACSEEWDYKAATVIIESKTDGEDWKVIYENNDIRKESEPIDINLDISESDYIRISNMQLNTVLGYTYVYITDFEVSR